VRLIAQIGRRWRAVLLVLAGALVGGAAFAAADVPDTSGVIHACYQLSDPNQPPNQTPGNLYIIDPSRGQSCPGPAGSAPALDWNFAGPRGSRGPQGPPGNAVTLATPPVKRSSGPIGHVDLGTGSHKLSFKIVEVSLGSHGAGGGGGAGKVKFHDITITKKVEPSSPALSLSLSRGEHFKKAVIVCRKAGEKPLEYFTITLSDANVSAVQTQPASGDEGPTEQITFVYGQVKVEYQPQNP
jgi:type VI protein secretion system component Hcp